ncbi:MAG: 8-oxoguanine DNA glycosylase, N-terminal domain-containing protein, partial [Clostridia bacterium]|nr:8-oxoguanine DNA glycosylase, N-terminal domain-containing protein [Clostridia bacterium]
MNIIKHENYIEINNIERFAPKHTFECGQCFRWFEKDGKFEGVAMGRKLTVWADENAMYMTASKADFENIWRRYFDLDRSYESIAKAFTGDEFFAQAVEYGLGLRLLKQDPWEALCSFIISQCNNIS